MKSFVTITNHLTNDSTKEEFMIAKVKERRIKAQANLARLD